MDSKIVFPEIEGVDWAYALHKMQSEKMLFEATRDFCALNEAEAMTLERSLNQMLSGGEASLEEYRIKVHSMKSSAALIGAMSVSSLAKALEYAAKEKNMSVITCVTPFFLREWRRLKERMKDMFAEKEGKKKVPDYYLLVEYLKLLKASAADMDIDTSDEIVRQMHSFCYPEGEAERVEELSLAVAEIDADRIMALSEELEELFLQNMI